MDSAVKQSCIEMLEGRMLLSAGYLDSSFGDQGVQNIQNGTSNGPGGAAVQADGKVVVLAGATANEVQRLQTSGATDTTFGSNGFATLPSAGGAKYQNITVEADGKIIVWGPDVIARLNSNGSVDASFGGTGAINTPVGYLAVQENEAIVVSQGGEANQSPTVYRINANGVRDGSFNNGTGSVVMPLNTASPNSWVGGVAITPSQQIVVSVAQGETAPDPGETQIQYGVVRLLSSGAVDTSFGTNGLALNSYGIDTYPTSAGDDDMPDEIQVDSNGAIYQLGDYTIDPGQWEYSLYAYTPTGDTAGAANVGNDSNNVSGFTIQPNNEVVAVAAAPGYTGDSEDQPANYVVVSCFQPYYPAGLQALNPDYSFGNGGAGGAPVAGESAILFEPVDHPSDDGANDVVGPESIVAGSNGRLILTVDFHGTVSNLQRVAAIGQGTTNTPTTGVVEGSVINDVNHNGVADPGETGEEGVTIYADLNNNGKLDSGEPSTVTASDGSYVLSGVPAGAQVIRQIVPAGQTQTKPANGLGNHITLQDGGVTSGVVFADYTSGSTIDGTVSLSNGAAAPSGWKVYLDLNNNGSEDSTEPWTTTASNGSFYFQGLAAGTYIVRVTAPNGFTQVSPSDNYGQHITVGAGQTVSGANFTFKAPATVGGIAGTVNLSIGTTAPAGWTVYLDLNNNLSDDNGEPTTVTASNGSYYFPDLEPGNYIVRVIAPSGYTQITPSDNLGHHVTVSAGQTDSAVNFTFMPAATSSTVSGTVYLDYSGGVLLSGFGGVTVYSDLNDNDKLDPGEPSTLTDANGNYTLNGVPVGTQVIRAVIPTGDEQISPEDQYGDVENVPVGNIKGADFSLSGPTNVDSSFGNDGMTTLPSESTDYPTSPLLAVQSNNDIVLLGFNNGIQLRRLLPNGAVDTSFGTGGTSVSVNDTASQASGGHTALVIASNGEIFAGSGGEVVSFNSNGSLNTAFGSGTGYVTLPDNDAVCGIALQSNGQILVDVGNGIYRLNANGTIDTSYGNGGLAQVSVPLSGGGIAIDSSGRAVISIGGYPPTGAPVNLGSFGVYALERFTTSGQVDTTFGDDGVAWGANADDGANGYSAVAIGPNGTIYQALSFDYLEGDEVPQVDAYSPSGSFLNGAGLGDLPDVPSGFSDANLSELAVQSDGKVVVIGIVDDGNGDSGGELVARFNADLSPDTSFDGDGVAVLHVVGPQGQQQGDFGVSVGVQTFGNNVDIVAAGYSNGSIYWDNYGDNPPTTVEEATLFRLTGGTVSTPTTGVVSGTVYNDANGNGTRDSGEAGVAGVTVYVDLNNNGKLDAGEPSTTTDAYGNYAIAGVPAGADIIRQVLPSGETQTRPTGGLGQHITVTANGGTSDVNFGDEATVGGIAGTVRLSNGTTAPGDWTVYLDLNNNGKQDSGEPATITAGNGSYYFPNLAPGNYIVRVIAPSGYTQVTPADNYGDHVTVTAGQTLSAVNFTFQSNSTDSVATSVFSDTAIDQGWLVGT